LVRIRIRSEDYLKAIYEICKEKGYVRAKDIANKLNVSPSTVTEMLQRLKNDGFVNYEKYGGITLTKKGIEKAKILVERFRILKEFLQILGVDEKVALEDAHKIEHVVSPQTIYLLTKFVEFMKTRENPRWLKRFKKYCETGELPKCPKKEKEN